MNRQEIIELIRTQKNALESLGIGHMYLYGSHLRGEAQAESDVDIFYEYENPSFSLFDQMDVRDRLQNILKCRVDLVSRNALHPAMKSEIEKSAVNIF